jgi:N utilization substance protein B
MDKEKREKITPDTLAFSTLIITGTINNLARIDEVIKLHLEHWDFNRLSRVDRANLRISVYCILFQEDIPATVTIDEAIDIAKEFGNTDSYRFVNGVLDSIYKSIKNKEKE